MGVLVYTCFWSSVTHTLSFKPVLRVQHRRLVASCALPCEARVPLALGEPYSINKSVIRVKFHSAHFRK